MCAGTEEEPASRVFYLLLATQQQPLYVLFVLSSLLLHLPPQHRLSNHFLAIGSVKERCNGLLLCNSLLAKLNFEVNYEPQLPSQCTYLKEGYNLRTLERLLQWRTPHWLGVLGPSFFEVVCPPPLGACAMCGLVVHYFAGILMDCLCKSQTYKLLFLDFYTWNSKFQIEEPQSWFGPDISCLALKLPKIDT
jgi:hypothetical protein